MATSVISSPTYDPQTTAENLANAYIAGTQAILTKQSTKATAVSSGLTTLSSALSAFQSTLQSLTSSTAAVTANSATFSNTAIGTATASSGAAAGTYSFYVQQLATAGQVSYNVADSSATNAGAMNVVLADGSTFEVDLANADSNGDGVLSAKEVAAAINTAADNNSRVTASIMTVNGQSQLIMSSTATGADNAVASLDVSGLGDASLASALSAQTVLTTAQNAVIYVGGKNGTKVEQASNTFSVIDNVKFTINQAQGTNDAAVTLTVAPDSSGTVANVQKFVDAYNTLLGVFTTLTKAGDHTVVETTSSTSTGSTISPTSEDAAFYNDSGVQALRDRLGQALRAMTDGQSLISFGITSNRDGTLSIDSTRLNKAVAANPGKIDSLFGRAGLGVNSGALGAMNTLVTAWTNSSNGYIKSRQEAVTKQQDDITDRQATLKTQFDNAYKRYLAQFTALQELQSSMTTTSNMFTALFSSDSSS